MADGFGGTSLGDVINPGSETYNQKKFRYSKFANKNIDAALLPASDRLPTAGTTDDEKIADCSIQCDIRPLCKGFTLGPDFTSCYQILADKND